VQQDAGSEGLPADPRATARSELIQACGWIALGIATLVGSLRMDRLERQNINPYTVPGLLPGLLGAAMVLLGTLLALRSWRRGALEARHAAFAFDPAAARRVVLVLALCLTFGVVLVGHGVPFWLAAASFVSIAIVVLQRPQRRAAGERMALGTVASAIVIGLCAGGAITLVFQQLFLVRLP
jgi:hypothetical protein